MEELLLNKHKRYFKRVLDVLPSHQLDTHRVSLAFFAISGLDVLGQLDELDERRQDIIKWVYSLQIQPNGSNLSKCGFRGCSALGHAFDTSKSVYENIPYDSSNIAMTYTALVCLLILNDDLSGVHKKAVLSGIKSLQQSNGSFVSVIEGSECDMRFVYCACCVCYILNDWSGMDKDKTTSYIIRSLSYDGAFGQGPFNEAHGGSTFCAVASLYLMGTLTSALNKRQLAQLTRWLLQRQDTGFTGRPNKPADTCYSFWVGASLQMLGVFDLSNVTYNRGFILSTQSSLTGGLSKYPDHTPDPLHTYLGLCGLSLIGEPGLNPIFSALNMTQRAYDHLCNLHRQWQERE